MTIVGILMGIAAVITGICLAKRRGRKLWYVLTAVGACICGISLFFLVCALLLTNAIQQQPPAGQNSDLPNSGWRTEHSYSKDYMVGDGVNVCFAWSTGAEEQEGWRVFDSNDGDVIQLLTPQGCPEQCFSNHYGVLQAEDYDGDEKNELGIGATSGAVLWYKWNGNGFQYLWTETGVSVSIESRLYEPYAEDGLTEKQRTLYEEMQPKIFAREPFSYDAATYGYDTLDDTFVAWAALSADNPEIDNYFMLKENIDENGRTLSLDSFYYCSWTEDEETDPSELTKGITEFDRVCHEILAGMPENAPTYEKYRYLAQAVSERADYD